MKHLEHLPITSSFRCVRVRALIGGLMIVLSMFPSAHATFTTGSDTDDLIDHLHGAADLRGQELPEQEIPAQGALTNGANHSGTIQVGTDVDTWTIQATVNDSINLSLAEVLVPGPDPGFRPTLLLLRPDGATVSGSNGTQVAEIRARAPMTGVYTVKVSNNIPGSQVAPVNYTLTVTKTPGPYTVSAGDQGGPLTNGANHPGVIPLGDQDTWTIDATFNESINLSIAEVLVAGPDPGFRPNLLLLGPDGATLSGSNGTQVAEIRVRAPMTGVYTVLVSNEIPNSQVGDVNYALTLTKTPGPYTVSAGDEGGPLTNGANHPGVIMVGDQDTWIINATFNESINLSLAEVLVAGPDPGFRPNLLLLGPDGATVSGSNGTQVAEIRVRAPMSGVYTVLVSNNIPNSQVGAVDYTLTVSKTPGPYTVSAGDEGGPLANGANHSGVITVGDQDTWTISATFNESINLTLAEVLVAGPDPGFRPNLLLLGPDGATVSGSNGTQVAEIRVRAPMTGVYTVLVSNEIPNSQVGDVNYTLTVTKTPGPYTVSAGDQGGPLTNGANHPGVIPIGDQDTWIINATFNESINLSIAEVLVAGPDPGFRPNLLLLGPDGATVSGSNGSQVAEIGVRAPMTGVYTVLVSNEIPNSQVGDVNYTLTLTKTPGPYTVSPGDEGGPLTNGANHPGIIPVGDLDTWTFNASANDSITLTLTEVSGGGPDPGFSPRLRLIAPTGATVSGVSGVNVAEISTQVPLSGFYTVVVSNDFPNSQVGAVSYLLKFTGPTQTTPTPTPTGTPAISGTVTYGNAIPPATRFVSNVLISGAGSIPVSTLTNFPGGAYSLTGFGAGSYTITPTKTGGANSITSFDAAKISQHVAGTSPLTGNQLLVADVSNNGSISSFDAAEIANYVVASSPSGTTGTWRFSPPNRTYATVSSNVTDENYTALLMGEVSGNWTNTGARPVDSRPLGARDDSGSSIQLKLAVAGHSGAERSLAVTAPRLVTPADNEVIIPVTVDGIADKGIIAYEFDLRYDPLVIHPQTDPVDLKGTVSSKLSIAVGTAEAGLLRVAVYGPKPIDAIGPLLNLRFRAVGAPGSVSALIWERIVFNEGESETTVSDGEVALSAGGADQAEISGRLLGPIGQGIPNAYVILTDTAGQSRTVVSNRAGVYKFGGLQVGQTYMISVDSRPVPVSLTGQLVSVDLIVDQ